MYHPTTRLLTILEMLQAYPALSGEELAHRLEVEARTVRRYILMLQELGIPVEGIRGPGGGYRLRPGFKLPPLLFTEEEATAVLLGLLGTPWLEVDLSPVAVEGALAKVYRVLPMRGRERLQAISAYRVLSPDGDHILPNATLLVDIGAAIQSCHRISIDYSSHHNEFTQRKVEPYGIVAWRGHWYLIAYCCLRQGYRFFRLDRMTNMQLLDETFMRAEDFDCHAYVSKHLTAVPAKWEIEVEFQAEFHTVRQKIPASRGKLTATETGVLLHYSYDDLSSVARYLMSLDLPFIVRHPAELRDEFLRLAEKMIQIAKSGM